MAKRKILSMRSFLAKKYNQIHLGEPFSRSFGEVEIGSRWLIYGESGNGKTELCVQLAKEISRHGKVLYVSREQGDSSSLQFCFHRNKMEEQHGKVRLVKDVSYTEMCRIIEKSRAKAVIIDSIDYMGITKDQYKELSEKYRKTLIVMVSWAEGKKPISAAAKAIEYMVDVKIRVQGFAAFPRSRYGGNEPYLIWKKKAEENFPFLITHEDEA